jgi:hypothetical protein
MGDYKGGDTFGQKILSEYKTDVTVYHMFQKSRVVHNGSKTKGGYTSDLDRDSNMSKESNGGHCMG